MSEIPGVRPHVPTPVLPGWAKQAAAPPYRCDLVDAPALFQLAAVLAKGAAKYGEDNWRGIPVELQINHALQHLYAFLAGDTSDDHLGHAFCRCMMALAVKLQSEHRRHEAGTLHTR